MGVRCKISVLVFGASGVGYMVRGVECINGQGSEARGIWLGVRGVGYMLRGVGRGVWVMWLGVWGMGFMMSGV